MFNITNIGLGLSVKRKNINEKAEKNNDTKSSSNDLVSSNVDGHKFGEALKSKFLVSFSGKSNLNGLGWGDLVEKPTSKVAAQTPAKHAQEATPETHAEEPQSIDEMRWGSPNGSRVVKSEPKHSSATRREQIIDQIVPRESNNNKTAKNGKQNLSKEERKELQREKILDQLVAREKRRHLVNTIKAGALGTLLATGAFVTAPYVPEITRRAQQVGDVMELIDNPECIRPSLAAGEILVPTPEDLKKVEGQEDPYNLTTDNICISSSEIAHIREMQELIQNRDMYLQLSPEEIQAFNEMKQYSNSYMEIDSEGNRQSYISFLPREITLRDGRTLPEGTIFFETFVNRGVNNSKRVELIAYIDPETGFINNVEEDLRLNIPETFAPETLEGLQETVNAAQQVNEHVKTLISKFQNRQDPAISDTIIPEPNNNSFFKVRTHDLFILEEMLLRNNERSVIYRNPDNSVNMIFGRSNNQTEESQTIQERTRTLFNSFVDRNPFGQILSPFLDSIEYSFVFFEPGANLPDDINTADQVTLDALGDKISSFIFVTDDGTIGIISEDGILIPPLNTLDYNSDSFAEMLEIKNRIHEMRLDLFQDSKDDLYERFDQILRESGQITDLPGDIDYPAYPTLLSPDEINALHGVFIGNDSITLKSPDGASNVMTLNKNRDFYSKETSYTFNYQLFRGEPMITGTIDENGVIAFENTEGVDDLEISTAKRRILSIVEAANNQPERLEITQAQLNNN